MTNIIHPFSLWWGKGETAAKRQNNSILAKTCFAYAGILQRNKIQDSEKDSISIHIYHPSRSCHNGVASPIAI